MPEFVFPQGFWWGSATSAHQVEGNNTNNDWWAWEQAGRVKEPSGQACDHYRRFRDDFDLACELGNTAHRFSVEWSRVEPRQGSFDDEAIEHYREVVRALRERQLEPIVTLHHYTSPLWLAKQGGWADPSVVDAFHRYSRRMVEALGDTVRFWLTINEPMVFAYMHYLEGTGPPGERNLPLMLRVVEHLVRAHAAAYHAIHEAAAARRQTVQVSLAKHMPLFVPCRTRSPVDRFVAWLTDRVYNGAFLDAVTEGRWVIPGLVRRVMPEAKDTLDFLGVNYYSRQFIRFRGFSTTGWLGERCETAHHREIQERNTMGWEIFPAGLTERLLRLARYRLPIFITENGTSVLDDAQRERFILTHLHAVAKAIEAGVPVMGYLYWSLLDNFEWASGFDPRFGLIDVDYATQARRIRPSAWRFAQICRTNRLTPP